MAGDNRRGQKLAKGRECTGLVLWNQVCETDPAYTKEFTRGGGFKGTAIHPMYNVRKASEVFGGPCGTTWGFTEMETRIENGAPFLLGDQGQHLVYERIWFSKVSLWFAWEVDGKKVRCEGVPQWGATTMVQKTDKKGWMSDEEAAKKSFTDACSKCLSLLGFGADIHLGMYDDNKYVNDLRQRVDDEARQQNGDGGQSRQPRQSRTEQNQPGQHDRDAPNDPAPRDAVRKEEPAASEVPLMSLADFKTKVDKGIQMNDGIPLIGKMFENNQQQGQVAAGYLIDKKLVQANDLNKLSVVASKQAWMFKNGWLSETQNGHFNKMGKERHQALSAPANNAQ